MIHEITKTLLYEEKDYEELINKIPQSDYDKLNGEPYNILPNLPIITLLSQKYIAYQGQYWIFVQDIPTNLYNLIDSLDLTPHEGYYDNYNKFRTKYQKILNGEVSCHIITD